MLRFVTFEARAAADQGLDGREVALALDGLDLLGQRLAADTAVVDRQRGLEAGPDPGADIGQRDLRFAQLQLREQGQDRQNPLALVGALVGQAAKDAPDLRQEL